MLCYAMTLKVARFLLEFFVERGAPAVMRPLTNSNVILDFHRHHDAPYYAAVTSYLRARGVGVPAYEAQYSQLLSYFRHTKVLHRYTQCTLSAGNRFAPAPATARARSGVNACGARPLPLRPRTDLVAAS